VAFFILNVGGWLMINLPVILLVITTYAFTFINGFHDGCNVIATIISSRSISPKKALIIAALAEFISPLILGTAVASTIGKGIIKSDFLQIRGTGYAYLFILCAIVGAIVWNIITWRLGLPSSSSHALIGGLIGSGICIFGVNSIEWNNILVKVILMLFLTPTLGLIVGFILMLLTRMMLRHCKPGINKYIKASQLISMILLAASHSTNDSQKSMGIVTLILIISGVQDQFFVPFWVKLLSSSLISLGLYLGGWKIVKTVGRDIFRLKPMHSLVSQVSAAGVIFTSGLMGSPVSTSQIVSSSIMGVGSAEKYSAVRWHVAKRIFISWLTTIPAAASISALFYFIVTLLLVGGNRIGFIY
jgi:inorganic phosphate transporter, PiT family